MALVPDNQSPKISEPRKRSFNPPSFSIAPQLSAVLRLGLFPVTSMRNDQVYFQVFKLLTKWIGVVSFICDKSFRPLFRATTAWARNVDRFQCFFGQLYFRWRGRGKEASQRNTLAVDHHHPLCALSLFGFSNARAPFFAGAKLPSIKASSQSSTPFSSSMERNLRHTSSQTPWSSQSRNRRQQVEGLGYRSGKSCHRAPVRRIHNMPSKTSRLSVGGRPPFGFFRGSGSSGCSSFHWSSFMKRVYLAIGAPPIA